MTIGKELLTHISNAIHNPNADPVLVRGYAVMLVGAVEILTDSVNKLESSLDRIKGYAYPVDHPADITNLTPIERAIDKILCDAENTLASLGLGGYDERAQ